MLNVNKEKREIKKLKKIFEENTPFPYVVIPNAIDPNVLSNISEEVEILNPSLQKNFYGSVKKFTESRLSKLPYNTQNLLRFFNSKEFLEFLSKITGIDDLISDPDYEGGGVHKTYKGGFLKVHTDFNWNSKLKAYRRINVIIYLNKKWKKEWGGECEFWSFDRKTEVKKIQPIFNNLVIFNTNDYTFHGHPFPLKFPQNCSRNSIAVYFYTKNKDQIKHGKKSMETKYRNTISSEVNLSFLDKIKNLIPSRLKKLKHNRYD